MMVLLAPVATARAQDTQPLIDAVGAWADAQSLARLLPGARDGAGTDQAAKRARRRAKVKRPTRRQLRSLRFEVSDAVAARNRQAVLDQLPDEFDPALANADLDRITTRWGGFVRNELGWRTNDIGDATATALLMAYAAYHEVDPSRRASEAMRDDARTKLALDRRVRRRSDAEKQTAAEMLRYRLVLLLDELNAVRAEDQPSLEIIAEADLGDWVRDTFGVNLDGVRATGRGFVPRD